MKGIPVTGKFDVCPPFPFVFMRLILPQGGACACVIYIGTTMVTMYAHAPHGS